MNPPFFTHSINDLDYSKGVHNKVESEGILIQNRGLSYTKYT